MRARTYARGSMPGHDPRLARDLPAECTNVNVGMLWMEKRCSNSGTASLSTLTSRTSGSSWVAAYLKIGAAHG